VLAGWARRVNAWAGNRAATVVWRVLAGEPAVFAGGLDWAGVYWPDARVLDSDDDGVVSPAELAVGDHLIAPTRRRR
jgi:hypothetical protein